MTPVLEAVGIEKRFDAGGRLVGGLPRTVYAVNGVDLAVQRGEVVALVGESGSGKSTLGRTLLKLHEPDAGRIAWGGTDVTTFDDRRLRPLRRRLQMIFQDPQAALDPRMRVETLLADPLRAHRLAAKRELPARVAALLEQVGLEPDLARRYPHELSGGQRQRVGIARAISLEPELIVADEPVSALDVSVRAQILELLGELQRRLGLAFLFISHDLQVVERFADRVLVMYLGRIVESLPAASLSLHARHPYTRALLAAAPVPDPMARRARTPLPGEPPSPHVLPPGCAFAGRCAAVEPGCREGTPPLVNIGEGHRLSCPVMARSEVSS